MSLRNTFVTNLKKYRKEKHFSQMQLAEKCETSTSYIGEIEIGRKFPSIEMIENISIALEIKPYQLFIEEIDSYTKSINPEKKYLLIQKIQSSVEQIILNEEI